MDKDHTIDYMTYVDWHYKGPKSDEKAKSIRAKADKTQVPVEKEEEQLDSSYLLL